MSRVLAADLSVGVDVIEKLADALGVEPAELLRGDPRPKTRRNPGPRPRKRRAKT